MRRPQRERGPRHALIIRLQRTIPREGEIFDRSRETEFLKNEQRCPGVDRGGSHHSYPGRQQPTSHADVDAERDERPPGMGLASRGVRRLLVYPVPKVSLATGVKQAAGGTTPSWQLLQKCVELEPALPGPIGEGRCSITEAHRSHER
mgnify:FL=1